MTRQQQDAIWKQLSISRIKRLAGQLSTRTPLVDVSPLDDLYEQMAILLQQQGADRVELNSFPYGPEHSYFSWRVERSPRVQRAELWRIGDDGQEHRICSTMERPSCFMGSYHATPAEGEILDIVDVGHGTRPMKNRSRSLSGKIALASGHHFEAAMLETLAHRQAAGLLCGPGGAAVGGDELCLRQLAAPSFFGPHRPFGFNLSHEQYHDLARRLAAGEIVRCRVRIQLALDKGALPVISGQLTGSDHAQEKILLIAQLAVDEIPVGAAGIVEVLHLLHQLVIDGSLSPLPRSVQVMFVPHVIGLVAWLAESQETLAQLKAVIHLSLPDTLSIQQVQVLGPPSLQASFLPDLLAATLQRAASQRRPGSALPVAEALLPSGCILSPFLDLKLARPVVWLRGSKGTADRLPREADSPLSGLIAGLAATVLELATMQEVDLPLQLGACYFQALQRQIQRADQLRETIRRELEDKQGSSSVARHLLWQAQTRLNAGFQREAHVLHSCPIYLHGAGQQVLPLLETKAELERGTASLLRTLQQEIAAQCNPRARLVIRQPPLSALERLADAIIVHRTLSGPLPFVFLLRDAIPADRSWLAHHHYRVAQQPSGEALLQWVDGQRTLLDIYHGLLLDYPNADLKTIWRYGEVLQGAGFIELREALRVTTPGAFAAQRTGAIDGERGDC